MLGERSETEQPDPNSSGGGPVRKDFYNADGQLVCSIDPMGNVSAFAYDAFGNRVSTRLSDPENGQID
jgi:YD repeat-containing protein